MFKKLTCFLLVLCIALSVGTVIFADATEVPTEFISEAVTESETFNSYIPQFDSTMRYEMLFLLVIIALCYFETVLTNKENKILGLILPIISLIAMTVLTLFFTFKAENFSLIGFVVTLIFLNIPTIILYLFYHFGRKKYEKETKK